MALIKCPQCGHGVLSVATQCPQCSAALNKTPLDLGASGELGECRKCGRAVLSRLSACPNCGVPHPTRSYTRTVMVASVSVIGLAAWTTMAAMKHPAHHDKTAQISAMAKAMSAPPGDSRPAGPAVIQSKSAEMKSPDRKSTRLNSSH